MLNITNASPVAADIGSLERTTRVFKVISIAGHMNIAVRVKTQI